MPKPLLPLVDVHCPGARAILDEAPAHVAHASATPRQLEDSLLRGISPWHQTGDFAQDLTLAAQNHGGGSEQAWESALAGHGFVGGWKREWSLGDPQFTHDSLMEQVFEFSTAEGARDFQRSLTEATCGSSQDLFTVPGIPGAVGMRFVFEESGPDRVSDQVSFVVDKRRFVLVLGEPGGEPDRQQLFHLARQAYDNATRPGNLCRVLPGAFAEMAAFARSASRDPIADLSEVIVSDAPLGFDLRMQRKDRLVAGPRVTRGYEREWDVEGNASLTEHVAQHRTVKSALARLRSTSTNMCNGSDSVTMLHEIPGSLMFTSIQDNTLARMVLFARGTRTYEITYYGGVTDVPLEHLEAFAASAHERAR
ncbi:MAG: hypothetical protein GEU78_00680 [Actinobacteria bacterium]|nr:hypothetical protein [Actinomycetota bacterium]